MIETATNENVTEENDEALKRWTEELLVILRSGLDAAKRTYEDHLDPDPENPSLGLWTDGHAIRKEGVISICEGLLGQFGVALCDSLFPSGGNRSFEKHAPGALRELLGAGRITDHLVDWSVIKESVKRLHEETRPAQAKSGWVFPATPYVVEDLIDLDFLQGLGVPRKSLSSHPLGAAFAVRTMVDLFRVLEQHADRFKGLAEFGKKSEQRAEEILVQALKFLLGSQFAVADAKLETDDSSPAAGAGGSEPRGVGVWAWSWGDPALAAAIASKRVGKGKNKNKEKDNKDKDRASPTPLDNSLKRPSVFSTAVAAHALAAYCRHRHMLTKRLSAYAPPADDEVEKALTSALLWLDREGAASQPGYTAPGEWGEWGRDGKHALVLDIYALHALEAGWTALRQPDRFRESDAVTGALKRLYASTRIDGGVEAAYHTIGGQPGDPWVILFPWEDYSFPYLYLEFLCILATDYSSPRRARTVTEWVNLPFFNSLIREAWLVLRQEGKLDSRIDPTTIVGWNRLEYRVYCTSWALCAIARLLETIVTGDTRSPAQPGVLIGHRILELSTAETVFLALERSLIDRGFFGLFAEQVAQSVGRAVSLGFADERLAQFRSAQLGALLSPWRP